MTDKQIIIDGVDVSGCEYFKLNRGFNCYKGHNCTDKECYNCYYKQLKLAEQKLEEKDKEIERLKQGIKHYQRGMFLIINTATECRNNKQWNYKK